MLLYCPASCLRGHEHTLVFSAFISRPTSLKFFFFFFSHDKIDIISIEQKLACPSQFQTILLTFLMAFAQATLAAMAINYRLVADHS
jgi:hypothetical protein